MRKQVRIEIFKKIEPYLTYLDYSTPAIELAVSNKAHYVEDKRRIACIFFKLFKHGKFNPADVERTVEGLPEYDMSHLFFAEHLEYLQCTI